MKKQTLLLVAALSAVSLGFISAKNEALVSIDSIHIMQESKEGKILAEKLKGKINEYQEFVKKSQQEMTSLQDEVTKKADVLSKEALNEKTELLSSKKKNFERVLADKEETLRGELQREQMKLRDKQLAVVKSMGEEATWGVAFDKNTPGVLFVGNAIDKTSDVLKKVDEFYDKSTSTHKGGALIATNKDAATKTAPITKKA